MVEMETTTTIQETSKRLKVHIIISSVLFWIGITGVIIVLTAKSGTPTISATLMSIGIVWYFITRFRIWWHHK